MRVDVAHAINAPSPDAEGTFPQLVGSTFALRAAADNLRVSSFEASAWRRLAACMGRFRKLVGSTFARRATADNLRVSSYDAARQPEQRANRAVGEGWRRESPPLLFPATSDSDHFSQ